MTDKELKKLRRRDLLELLVQQTEDNERLQAKIDELTAQLENKNLTVEKAGSLADALTEINGMFKTADDTAKQYLENARMMARRTRASCEEREKMCRERCRAMIDETERECEKRRKEIDDYFNDRKSDRGKKS